MWLQLLREKEPPHDVSAEFAAHLYGFMAKADDPVPVGFGEGRNFSELMTELAIWPNSPWDPIEWPIELWIALGGLTLAIRSALLLKPNPLQIGIQWGRWPILSGAGTPFSPFLRRKIAQAPDMDYHLALDEVRVWRPSLSLEQRIYVDFLFPDQREWALEDARQALDSTTGTRLHGILFYDLASVTPDPELQAALLRASDLPPDLLQGPNMRSLALECLFVGGGAASLQAGFLRSKDLGLRKFTAQLLLDLGTDEALDILVENLSDRAVAPAVLEASQRYPWRSLQAAAERMAHSRNPTLRTFATQQFRNLPDPEPFLELMTPLARKTLETMKPGLRTEAEPKELPEILREPPWEKRLQVEATILALKAMDIPIQVDMEGLSPFRPRQDFEGSLREVCRRLIPQLRAEGADMNPLLASFEQNVSPWWKLDMYDLVSFDPDGAILLLKHLPKSRFSFQDGGAEGLLLHLGPGALEVFLRHSIGHPSFFFPLLQRFDAPQVAYHCAEARLHAPIARTHAETWLRRHAERAVWSLLPLALGANCDGKRVALAALNYLIQARGESRILELVGHFGSEAIQVYEMERRRALQTQLPKKMPKLPAFWKPGTFSIPLLKNGKALPLEALENLGLMLAISPLQSPYAGLKLVKQACSVESLAAFAWDLFQAWLLEGAPMKEAWAFAALAWLGDDGTVRELTRLIRAWPAQGTHARAVLGLDVLAKMGTDLALMNLFGISQKSKFKPLQERAREKIREVAEMLNLGEEELADRLVPDLGLDERGQLTLDFGSRQFTAGFDEWLRPILRDGMGQILKDLPKPTQVDEGEKAQAAVASWKALKKDAKTLAQQQLRRLETAMCTQRRWEVGSFRLLLAEHPLLRHAVKRLLWGVYNEDNRLLQAFRITEDGRFKNQKGDSLELSLESCVGLVHALELPEAWAREWVQIFGGKEMRQPFPQLGRACFALSEKELKQSTWEGCRDLKVPTGKLLGLCARDWRKGEAMGGGATCEIVKAMGKGLEAYVDFEPGIFLGDVQAEPEQMLYGLSLRKAGTWANSAPQTFEQLNPIQISELLRDVEKFKG